MCLRRSVLKEVKALSKELIIRMIAITNTERLAITVIFTGAVPRPCW
ncbi:hypothetical protein [Flavobacterium sp. MK4S-17]|nr:hypothetical protein [Flavobacterium sp. MK4S-17]